MLPCARGATPTDPHRPECRYKLCHHDGRDHGDRAVHAHACHATGMGRPRLFLQLGQASSGGLWSILGPVAAEYLKIFCELFNLAGIVQTSKIYINS
jgi:hypothetical protein